MNDHEIIHRKRGLTAFLPIIYFIAENVSKNSSSVISPMPGRTGISRRDGSELAVQLHFQTAIMSVLLHSDRKGNEVCLHLLANVIYTLTKLMRKEETDVWQILL